MPFGREVVSQATAYGLLLSVPITWPSTSTCTDVTPTSSLAVAAIVTVFASTAPFAGDVMATVGAVVSGVSFLTVTLTAADVVVLPAPSVPVAVIECVPFPTEVVSQLAV